MGSKEIITSKNHKELCFEGTRKLWENSILFDFTLEVEEVTVPAHKVVLASCSGYFRSMFSSCMKENQTSSVSLNSMSGKTLKTLISFSYTGDLELSAETVEDVLSGAHYLQMSSAVSLCSEYMLDYLAWENVTDVQNLARLYSLEDVLKGAENFMLSEFIDMPWPDEDEMMKMNTLKNELLKLLGRNDLCDYEYSLFEKLECFESVLTEDELCEALSKIRFPLMCMEDLEIVESSVFVTKCQHFLDEAKDYHKDVLKQSSLQTERTQVRSNKVTLVLATQKQIFGFRKDERPIEIKTFFDPDEIFDMVTIDNFLYVHCKRGWGYIDYGDGVTVSLDDEDDDNDESNFIRYDPRFDTWQNLPPFEKREDYAMVGYKNQIFAIGGYDTRTVQVYNIKSNDWSSCADINYDNARSIGVALGDKIYVCGGRKHNTRIFVDTVSLSLNSLNTVSCYDPSEDTWQFKAPMQRSRVDHNIVAFNDRVYIIGGLEHDTTFNMEYYIPETDQWTLVRLIQKEPDLGIQGVCSDGANIYIVRREDTKRLNSTKKVLYFDKVDMDTGKTTEAFNVYWPGTAFEQYTHVNYFCSSLILEKDI